MTKKTVSISMKISRERLLQNMDRLKELYTKLAEENSDLSVNDILKCCKISGKGKEQFLIYLKYNFCVEAIESHIDIDKTLFGEKRGLITKLENFKRIEIKKYAKLKSKIGFFTSTGTGKDEESKKFYNKGHKVQFEYDVPEAGLYVFKFDTYLFPLREDEFEWVL